MDDRLKWREASRDEVVQRHPPVSRRGFEKPRLLGAAEITSFGGNVSIPLFSLNNNNDQQLKIFDLPVTSGISGGVANAVAANLAAMRHPEPLGGEVFNVGVGERIRLLASAVGGLFTGKERVEAELQRFYHDEPGFIQEFARESDVAFVLEAGRENGDIVSARKGITTIHVELTGRAAHAGVEPERGRHAATPALTVIWVPPPPPCAPPACPVLRPS